MSGSATVGAFNNFPVFPKLVTDETLKRARVESSDGVSIKVSPLDPIPSADITDLKDNVALIKNTNASIDDKIGEPGDGPWDLSVPEVELIPIEKKNALDTHTIKTVLGSNEDTSGTASIVGILKSINENISGGSTVSIIPTLSEGTKIANFTIDGVAGELYAPNGGGGEPISLSTIRILETGKPVSGSFSDNSAPTLYITLDQSTGSYPTSFFDNLPEGTDYILFYWKTMNKLALCPLSSLLNNSGPFHLFSVSDTDHNNNIRSYADVILTKNVQSDYTEYGFSITRKAWQISMGMQSISTITATNFTSLPFTYDGQFLAYPATLTPLSIPEGSGSGGGADMSSYLKSQELTTRPDTSFSSNSPSITLPTPPSWCRILQITVRVGGRQTTVNAHYIPWPGVPHTIFSVDCEIWNPVLELFSHNWCEFEYDNATNSITWTNYVQWDEDFALDGKVTLQAKGIANCDTTTYPVNLKSVIALA